MLLLFPHPLLVTCIHVVSWLRIPAGNCMVPITLGKEGGRKGVCRKLGLVARVHPQSAPQCRDPSDGCWCGVRTWGHASFPCPCVSASTVAVLISCWFRLKRKGDAYKKGFLELGQKTTQFVSLRLKKDFGHSSLKYLRDFWKWMCFTGVTDRLRPANTHAESLQKPTSWP